jgi:hypothetical protein
MGGAGIINESDRATRAIVPVWLTKAFRKNLLPAARFFASVAQIPYWAGAPASKYLPIWRKLCAAWGI